MFILYRMLDEWEDVFNVDLTREFGKLCFKSRLLVCESLNALAVV